MIFNKKIKIKTIDLKINYPGIPKCSLKIAETQVPHPDIPAFTRRQNGYCLVFTCLYRYCASQVFHKGQISGFYRQFQLPVAGNMPVTCIKIPVSSEGKSDHFPAAAGNIFYLITGYKFKIIIFIQQQRKFLIEH